MMTGEPGAVLCIIHFRPAQTSVIMASLTHSPAPTDRVGLPEWAPKNFLWCSFPRGPLALPLHLPYHMGYLLFSAHSVHISNSVSQPSFPYLMNS